MSTGCNPVATMSSTARKMFVARKMDVCRGQWSDFTKYRYEGYDEGHEVFTKVGR